MGIVENDPDLSVLGEVKSDCFSDLKNWGLLYMDTRRENGLANIPWKNNIKSYNIKALALIVKIVRYQNCNY